MPTIHVTHTESLSILIGWVVDVETTDASYPRMIVEDIDGEEIRLAPLSGEYGTPDHNSTVTVLIPTIKSITIT